MKDLNSERESRLQNSKMYYRFQPLENITNACCDNPILNYKNRLDELTKESIWISDPERFNDPLDINLIVQDDTARNGFTQGSLAKAAGIVFSNNTPLPAAIDEELLNAIHLWINSQDNTSLVSAIKNRIKKYGVI